MELKNFVSSTFQIAPDNLKRGNVVRFSDEGLSGKSSVNNLAVGLSSKSLTSTSGNAALTLSDYMKESKTLNVNVLAEEDEEMNNEIRYTNCLLILEHFSVI